MSGKYFIFWYVIYNLLKFRVRLSGGLNFLHITSREHFQFPFQILPAVPESASTWNRCELYTDSKLNKLYSVVAEDALFSLG